MGIHRINWYFIEEFNSPGDLRFRIETDIRIPRAEDQGLVRRLRNAVEASRHEAVRELLLQRLEHPIQKRNAVSPSDLIRVKRLVTGALSNPRRPLPPEPTSDKPQRRRPVKSRRGGSRKVGGR
jgi:hypothetical protein